MNNTSSKQRETRSSTDHAARLVDRYFDIAGTELQVGGVSVSAIARQFGTPLFIYDADVICGKIDQLKSILPARFELFYSIKANPNAAILRQFLAKGCGLEVASGGELHQAIAAGCAPQDVLFAGPGKTEAELSAALDASIGEIHLESIDEARCLHRLVDQRSCKASVALRINPVDASGGAMRMGGQASPFGIDEEELDAVVTEILSMPGLDLAGIHMFMGTQILDVDVLAIQYRRTLELARQVADRIGHPLRTIDFGGGFGTPYFANESELDIDAVADLLADIDEEMAKDSRLNPAIGIIEPGRFLVGESGIYVAKVTRVKHSRGKRFAVIDGGMHHHLAASGNLGQTIKRNYPVAVLNKMGCPASDPVNVVGPLCTPLDMLARQAILPAMEPGDLVGVMQSGAYARTSSPHGFLSHDSPAEVLVVQGEPRLIRRRGLPEDHLRDQCDQGHEPHSRELCP